MLPVKFTERMKDMLGDEYEAFEAGFGSGERIQALRFNPLKGEKELDFSQSFMLYEVEVDEENNPIVLYIENDYEYAVAAQYFSRQLPKK